MKFEFLGTMDDDLFVITPMIAIDLAGPGRTTLVLSWLIFNAMIVVKRK